MIVPNSWKVCTKPTGAVPISTGSPFASVHTFLKKYTNLADRKVGQPKLGGLIVM